MKIAYIRVSTKEQSLEMQKNALSKYDIEKWIEDDGISGKSMDRPGMDKLLEILRPGDEVYVYSLSRLGRNTVELLSLAEDFQSRGIKLNSHTESIDATSPMGKMFFGMIALMGQLERELTEERRIQGVKTARDNGVKFGRKARLTAEQAAYIKQNPHVSIGVWIEKYGVSRSTVHRAKRP